jgi:hypothetical protein
MPFLLTISQLQHFSVLSAKLNNSTIWLEERELLRNTNERKRLRNELLHQKYHPKRATKPMGMNQYFVHFAVGDHFVGKVDSI